MPGTGSFYGVDLYGDDLYSYKEGTTWPFEADAYIPTNSIAEVGVILAFEAVATITVYCSSDPFIGYPWQPIPPIPDGWIPITPPSNGWQAIEQETGGPWIPIGPDRRPNYA